MPLVRDRALAAVKAALKGRHVAVLIDGTKANFLVEGVIARRVFWCCCSQLRRPLSALFRASTRPLQDKEHDATFQTRCMCLNNHGTQ